MKIYDINWKGLELIVDEFIDKIPPEVKAIHGICRGGYIPAVMISHKTGLPIQRHIGSFGVPEIMIIDDIYDSGQTMTPYLENGFTCGALITKPKHDDRVIYNTIVDDDQWVKFPWETEKSSKIDYLEK